MADRSHARVEVLDRMHVHSAVRIVALSGERLRGVDYYTLAGYNRRREKQCGREEEEGGGDKRSTDYSHLGAMEARMERQKRRGRVAEKNDAGVEEKLEAGVE